MSEARLKAIEQEQARLALEAEALQAQRDAPWPRRVRAYLHSSKESMWELGQACGLSDEACHEFMYALYEIAVDLEVNADGRYVIVAVDGRPLGDKP